MLPTFEPEPWTERALCAQTDPESFFPDKGGTSAPAKAVCRRCDVRAECLEYALAHDERFGIWGGLSVRERRKLKQQRPRKPPSGKRDPLETTVLMRQHGITPGQVRAWAHANRIDVASRGNPSRDVIEQYITTTTTEG